MPASPSGGGKKRRAVLFSIRDLVCPPGLSVPEMGLYVLKLAEAGLDSGLKLGDVRATLTTKLAEVRPNVAAVRRQEERLRVATLEC